VLITLWLQGVVAVDTTKAVGEGLVVIVHLLLKV
jgi:hypothetical protein